MKNGITKTQYIKFKKEYPGQYIALLDNKVISSGRTFKEVMKRIRSRDLKKIVFMHIRPAKTIFY